MNGDRLHFERPITDSISRIRFAPQSNNLLISSWDSNLRLYDVDRAVLRLEAPAEAEILDCCFQNDDNNAFGAGSDCSITRYDLHLGTHDRIGNHDDLATCVEYSNYTSQVISAGWDKKIRSWDTRMENSLGYSKFIGAKVESISVCAFNLLIAIGSSVQFYDLRSLNKLVEAKETPTEFKIKCVRSVLDCKGFAVGSIDGRVALKMFNPSNSSDKGYTFRCHPKSKDGKNYMVAVNDIVFNPSVSGAFATGNNEGYVTTWDAQSKRRSLELPRYPNSISSLSYNYEGELLAVASSYTNQEENEIEDPPQIYIQRMDDRNHIESFSAGSSSRS